MYDSVIIGAGPAGLTAAIYLLRAGKSVLVLERDAFGGQMALSPKIENYPGCGAVKGAELADRMVSNVLSLGADVEVEEALSIEKSEAGFVVKTSKNSYDCKTVIIATGAKHRRLGLEGEDELIGEGVSFCAVCDGAFYKDMNVVVVGGGNSAKQEALMLSDICAKVTMIQNLPTLTGEKHLDDEINACENIEVIYNSTVTGYLVSDHLTGVVIRNNETGATGEVAADGVFVAIGLEPDCRRFEGFVEVDAQGCAVSDENCLGSERGIFVAGDCRKKRVRQIASATADGVNAAFNAIAYIEGRSC